MPKWIRGHVSGFRIAISSVAAIVGVLLAVLPFASVVKVSAPVTACVVVFTMYLWTELGRPEGATHQAHVTDLQNFAGYAETIVGVTKGVDLTTPKGRSLRGHFPKLAKEIDEWDALVQRLRGIDERFAQFTADEAIRLGFGSNTALPTILNYLVRHIVSLSELTWQTQPGWIFADTWGIAALPPDEAATCKLLADVWDSLTTVNEKPAVREYNEIHRKVEDARAKLIYGLGTVQAKHRPEGHCDLCPT